MELTIGEPLIELFAFHGATTLVIDSDFVIGVVFMVVDPNILFWIHVGDAAWYGFTCRSLSLKALKLMSILSRR